MTETGYLYLNCPVTVGMGKKPHRYSPPAPDHKRSPQYLAALEDGRRWLESHEKAVKAQRVLWRQVSGLPPEAA